MHATILRKLKNPNLTKLITCLNFFKGFMKTANKPTVAKQVLVFLLSEHITLQNGKTHLSREGQTGSSKMRPMSKKLQLYHNFVTNISI